jgi:DNA-binding CsgD family transcriptional regulator
VLFGRQAECDQIDRLLAAARSGESDAVLIRGEAGVGKSALLRYAIEQADEMTVLSAAGVESESELAFAGLGDLVRARLGELDRLPEVQAAAIRGVLTLAEPTGGLAVGAATLGLLGSIAESGPVLVAVDDVHWLDQASAQALLFATRRLHAEGVAVLLAARTGESNLFDDAALTTVELAGLELAAALELLANAVAGTRRLDSAVAERLVTITTGNPLALVELPGLLSDEQLLGTAPLDQPLPVGVTIERAFARRLEAIPSATRQLLLLAAASDSRTLGPILGAARLLGIDSAALEPAETAGLVSVDGDQLAFQHPLMQSVVYQTAAPAQRRHAHRALADALDPERPSEQHAWHLAAATLEPDEEIASVLELAAADVRDRGGYLAAAGLCERSAQLSPGRDQRAQRLLAAARDFQFGGRLDRSLGLLEQGVALTEDPLFRADAQRLRAHILTWAGAPADAHRLWLDEVERIEPIDPERAASMLAEAAIVSTMRGNVPEVVAISERAYRLAERSGGSTTVFALAVYSNALILDGRADEALPLLERCQAAFDVLDPLTVMPVLTQPLGHGRIWIEHYAEARRVLERTVDAARLAAAIGLLPFPLACLAELEIRTGQWTRAYAHASESVRLAEETGQTNERCFSLAILATVEAGLGREQDCRAHAEQALVWVKALGIDSLLVYIGSALGVLELSLGRPEKALTHLVPAGEFIRTSGCREPGVVWWAADLIEAQIRAGRPDDAKHNLNLFERDADRTQRTWALAAAGRCRALLADNQHFEEEFTNALTWHERAETPFEYARTLLCLGERLRRIRKPTRAREPLRAAREIFSRLDAAVWEQHVEAELRATGEAPQSAPPPRLLSQLTPQELQVALSIAAGATNREAATALFLSPKTIEFHLANIYRKLHLRSRSELTRNIFDVTRERDAGDP